MLSLVLLGDLVSLYLAVLRGVDPTPVELDRAAQGSAWPSARAEAGCRELSHRRGHRQLREAERGEQSSIGLLESHLRGAPLGPYRASAAPSPRRDAPHGTRSPSACTTSARSRSPLATAIDLGEAVAGRVTRLRRSRRSSLPTSRSRPEALLRDAGDDIAAEAREVATYEALERARRGRGRRDDRARSRARSAPTRSACCEALAGAASTRWPTAVARQPLGGQALGPTAEQTPARAEPPAPSRAAPPRANGGLGAHRARDARTPTAPSSRDGGQLSPRRRADPHAPTRREPASADAAPRPAVESEGAADVAAPSFAVEAPWAGYGAHDGRRDVAGSGSPDERREPGRACTTRRPTEPQERCRRRRATAEPRSRGKP